MKNKKNRIVFTLVAAFVGVLCALALTASFSIMKVQGPAMEPEISQGNFVIVNKLAYVFGTPEQGDVVTFHCNVYNEDGEGSILVKRVVATAGDLVEIREGSLYVNKKIYEKHMTEPVYMDAMEPITVAEGKVFVLSDNRESVMDSRDSAVGQLSVTELSGKVCFE